jgi:hypothetical protein
MKKKTLKIKIKISGDGLKKSQKNTKTIIAMVARIIMITMN